MKNLVRLTQKAKTVPQKMYMGWIRTYLRNHFPETRFRLSIKSYTGGKSLRVSWQGGPEETELSDLQTMYSGAKIDRYQKKMIVETLITRPGGVIMCVKLGFDFIILNRRLPSGY